MNPIIVMLMIVCAVLLWAILAFSFGFIGKMFGRLAEDVKKAMFDEREENNNEE